MRATVAALALLLCGCSHQAVRELTSREQKYFEALSTELKRGGAGLQKVVEGNRVAEEQAIREVVLYQAKAEAARLVYSVREVLTAPSTNRAPFIQATRNRIVLLQVASLADFEEERLAAELAAGDARRHDLQELVLQLHANVADVIATGRALHGYLDQGDVQGIAAVAGEIKRQLDAFSSGLAQADQTNSVVKVLATRAAEADKPVAQANDAIGKFIDLWSRLNKSKE
jgi:hypothetical protein